MSCTEAAAHPDGFATNSSLGRANPNQQKLSNVATKPVQHHRERKRLTDATAVYQFTHTHAAGSAHPRQARCKLRH